MVADRNSIVALPAFWWLSAVPHPAVLLLIVALLVGLTTLGSVPTMLMISELFPQRIRAGVCVGLQPRGGDLRRFCPVHRLAVDRAERLAAGARRLFDAGDAGFAGGTAAAARNRRRAAALAGIRRKNAGGFTVGVWRCYRFRLAFRPQGGRSRCAFPCALRRW
ncbi:hypothetical protein M8494_08990 [Serratia ureilytica]